MKRFLNLRLSFLFAIFLIVGISCAYFLFSEQIVLAIVFPSALLFCLIIYIIFSLVKKNYVSPFIVALLCISFAILGYFSFNVQLKDYQTHEIEENSYDFITCRVESVSLTQLGVLLQVGDIVIDTQEVDGKMNVYANGESAIDVGDLITFSGYIEVKTAFYDGKFSRYDVQRNVKYICMLESVESISVTGRDRTVFESVNVLIRDTLSNGLEGDEFAVAYALLTGNGEYFDDDVITNFRQAGVAHIFAVSGLHIGFLYSVLYFICKKLKVNKFVLPIVIALCLFFYSGVCGFSASSIRASIMCAVMMITRLFGEKYDGISSLSISCVIVLLVSPVQLLLEGFQLSFAVVFGILTCTPGFKRLLKFLPDKIASTLATCVPAYLFGIPISLYAFGEFSTIAILINFLFIPFVAIIYITLLVCTLLCSIIGLEYIILFAPKYVLKAIVYLIGILDYDIFMVSGFTFGIFALLYYLTFLVACGFFNFNKLYKPIVSVILAIICALGVVLKTLDEKKEVNYIISGDEHLSFTLIDTKKQDVLIVSDASRLFSANRLARAINQAQSDKITVVFLNSVDLDVQVILTKINYAVKVNNVYFHAPSQENSAMVESIVKASFLDVSVYPYTNGHLFTCAGVDVIVDEKGYSASAIEGENSLSIFVKFGDDGAKYDSLSITPNAIVAYDYLEDIGAKYKDSKLISYRDNQELSNGESEGNFIYSFD